MLVVVASALAVGMFGHTGTYRCQLALAVIWQTKGVGITSPVTSQAGGFTNGQKGSFCLTALTPVAE